jgi:putative hydrolase of HD superfamily
VSEVAEFQTVNGANGFHPHLSLVKGLSPLEMPGHTPEDIDRAVDIYMSLGRLSMNFANIKRAPRYADGRRENDAEHSFMHSIVTTELAHAFYPHLNVGTVGLMCNAHDIVETATCVEYDVPTFALSDSELAVKAAEEEAALQSLLPKLPPLMRSLVIEYEEQRLPEARFVKCSDKNLPVVVDIIGQGERVMREDYGITTREQLDEVEHNFSSRVRNRFPEFELLHRARDAMHQQFADLIFPKITAAP